MKEDYAHMKSIPPQHQDEQPGLEYKMNPRPQYIRLGYKGSDKLKGKVAVISGGDSGIGRAIAVHMACEGATTVILYLKEHADAHDTEQLVKLYGGDCLLISGDLGKPRFCRNAIEKIYKRFGAIDVLVNNAAEQHYAEELDEISEKQIEETFRTNIFSMFYLTKYALRYMKRGGAIINTTSITAYRGSEHLIDYASTKGAILAFTRSLSTNLVKKGIRVNAVAPGPIWTPFIPSSFPAEKVKQFGKNQPMGRPGQPSEVAPAYVFLASEDASYITGQTIHPNGGEIVGG